MPQNHAPSAVLHRPNDRSVRDILIELFDVAATDVTAVATLDDAKRARDRRTYDLIVTDLNLAGKRDGGLQVMVAAGLFSTDAPIIVLTAFPDALNRTSLIVLARRTSSRSRLTSPRSRRSRSVMVSVRR